MLKYRKDLKSNARRLRRGTTDSETKLWSRLRRKQIFGVQFYRQKPVGDYIVDFYASKPRLVVEIDGSQHMEKERERKDERRDMYLKSQGLQVLRFNNLQVLQETDSVVDVIYRTVKEKIKIPLNPPFSKGESFASTGGGKYF